MQEIGENIRFLEGVGEYTPYGIASFLTAYRFTPIGREMLSGKRPYKPSRVEGNDPLQEEVPYEIQDFRVEVLLDLTLRAFQGFNELPRTLRKLKSEARRKNSNILFKLHKDAVRYFSEASMHYFKELHGFLSQENPRFIKKYFERISAEIRDYTSTTVNKLELILE